MLTADNETDTRDERENLFAVPEKTGEAEKLPIEHEEEREEEVGG